MMDIVTTDKAPKAIGPYSQAIKSNGFVFCSGQIPLKADGNLLTGTIAEQTRQVLENLKAVLNAAGSHLDKVVKTTVYLTDMSSFAEMNDVYAEFFSNNKPARATVAVTALPKNVQVEIECVAVL